VTISGFLRQQQLIDPKLVTCVSEKMLSECFLLCRVFFHSLTYRVTFLKRHPPEYFIISHNFNTLINSTMICKLMTFTFLALPKSINRSSYQLETSHPREELECGNVHFYEWTKVRNAFTINAYQVPFYKFVVKNPTYNHFYEWDEF